MYHLFKHFNKNSILFNLFFGSSALISEIGDFGWEI